MSKNRPQDAHNNCFLQAQNRLPERKIDSQIPKIDFQGQKLTPITPRDQKSISGTKKYDPTCTSRLTQKKI